MATLDYIDIPAGATRLRSSSGPTDDHGPASLTNNIRPAPRITTSLPHPSPPSPPSKAKSPTGSTFGNLASPTVGLLPQLMLQASIPGLSSITTPSAGTAGGPAAAAGANVPTNPRGKLDNEPYTLLSTRDPLSLPIMTTNFKRFISIIGPVFWLQDRVEEVLLWKRGPTWTGIWMGAYGLICFFPRALLLLPHFSIISIILATYPYPSDPSQNPIYKVGESLSENGSRTVPPPTHPPEGSIPWQANIQGIQNLMGAVADAHALVEPHVYHLCLRPSHLSTSVKASTEATSPNVPTSPYTPHILVFLVITFFPLLFLVNLPVFPIREVCLIAGWAPFLVMHPWTQALAPKAGVMAQELWATHREEVFAYLSIVQTRLMRLRSFILRTPPKSSTSTKSSLSMLDSFGSADSASTSTQLPLKMRLQRFLDDDKLTDQCWNSEMREVEIWENERYSETAQPPSGVKGWSKRNLKPTERMAWTRGRDGWSGIGNVNANGEGEEGYGEVSSNLTFSLAPGWAFVETEDWRQDLSAEWSGFGGDEDGWVYTNDAWLGSRPALYGAGGGSVTRRRRWVRRIWFDQDRAERDA